MPTTFRPIWNPPNSKLHRKNTVMGVNEIPKIVKSFRLDLSTIEMLQTLRRKNGYYSTRSKESEADVIDRLIRDAYRQRNTNHDPGT